MASSASTSSHPGRKTVDLAFAMDCTGSMGSYIENARQNISQISQEIISKEMVDLRFALVEYRDHPPQEKTFVTNVLDFTNRLDEMKSRLDKCSASGGGDGPEAIADALDAVLKLSWRPESVKMCVLIADAPPHGLVASGDGFPNGCPCKIDPMVTARELAEKQVTVYTVGCEPSISQYKEWFMAISYLTSGQYVPLSSANVLSQIVVAGTMEECSLYDLMPEVQAEVNRLVEESAGKISEEELSKRVFEKLKDAKTKKIESDLRALEQATEMAVKLAEQETMADVKCIFSPSKNTAKKDETAFKHEVYKATETKLTIEQAKRLVSKTRAAARSGYSTRAAVKRLAKK